MRQTLQDRRAKRFFYLKNKKPFLTSWAWLSMFFYLTEIFLSIASAERCKINFGKFWVEVLWLPERWAGRGGQVPWLYLCSWGRGHGHPSCQPWGLQVGCMNSVSALRWERQCSLGRVVWNRAACEHGASSPLLSLETGLPTQPLPRTRAWI